MFNLFDKMCFFFIVQAINIIIGKLISLLVFFYYFFNYEHGKHVGTIKSKMPAGAKGETFLYCSHSRKY